MTVFAYYNYNARPLDFGVEPFRTAEALNKSTFQTPSRQTAVSFL